MDRIGACGASGVGPIPTEGIIENAERRFFIMPSEKANCFAFVRNRRPEYSAKRYEVEDWGGTQSKDLLR